MFGLMLRPLLILTILSLLTEGKCTQFGAMLNVVKEATDEE